MITLPTIYPGEVYLQDERSPFRMRGEVELPRWPPSLNGPSPGKVDTARSGRPHQLGYSSTSLQMNSTEKRSRHLSMKRIITEALGLVLGIFLHDGLTVPIARLCAMKRRASGLPPDTRGTSTVLPPSCDLPQVGHFRFHLLFSPTQNGRKRQRNDIWGTPF